MNTNPKHKNKIATSGRIAVSESILDSGSGCHSVRAWRIFCIQYNHDYYINNRDRLKKSKHDKYFNECEKKRAAWGQRYENNDRFRANIIARELKKIEKRRSQQETKALRQRIANEKWHRKPTSKARISARCKFRRENDINIKLCSILRCRLYQVARGCISHRGALLLLGCSIEQFKNHIQSLFKPEMNFSNHGKKGWHIDHIRPCSSFDMSDPVQRSVCFHYTNLQPLWAVENIKKGARYERQNLKATPCA